MKLQFTRKTGSHRLILIFAGWGSDVALYNHIEMPGWDVAVAYGLEAPEEILHTGLESYSTIFLYAWSLGVASAELIGERLQVSAAFAINGTWRPVSDKYGIPEAVFTATEANLSEQAFAKFKRRMFDSSSSYNAVKDNFPLVADIDKLKEELRYIFSHKQIFDSRKKPVIDWKRVFVGKNDAIFPYESQIKAWKDVADVVTLNEPHYIDIQKIVKSTIVDAERVKARFEKSLPTYSDEAISQKKIAHRLADSFISSYSHQIKSILEVGSGTGLLTNEWKKFCTPETAMFVDLCEMPAYRVCDEEEYIVGDAEIIMNHLEPTLKFDAIVSASTIQWFSDLSQFFRLCRQHLTDAGFIAMSSFLPGNLPEVSTNGSSVLAYYNISELRNFLTPYFKNILIEEDEVRIGFDSPLSALKHLQLTGVTGVKNTTTTEVRSILNNLEPSFDGRYYLTFKPVYIYASNTF